MGVAGGGESVLASVVAAVRWSSFCALVGARVVAADRECGEKRRGTDRKMGEYMRGETAVRPAVDLAASGGSIWQQRFVLAALLSHTDSSEFSTQS